MAFQQRDAVAGQLAQQQTAAMAGDGALGKPRELRVGEDVRVLDIAVDRLQAGAEHDGEFRLAMADPLQNAFNGRRGAHRT
jgi:hypothetical protein